MEYALRLIFLLSGGALSCRFYEGASRLVWVNFSLELLSGIT